MNRNFDFHPAGPSSGLKGKVPIGSEGIPETKTSLVPFCDAQFSADNNVKLERRSSSISLGLQDIPGRDLSAGCKPLNPGQSGVSGIYGRSEEGTSAASPLPLESPGAIIVPQQAKHALPKAQRAGRSEGPVQPTRGATRFHHHPHVWESHKAEIEDIYMHQNKSLKQLMDVMKDKGFKAT